MAAAACSYDPLEKALSSVLQGLNSLGLSKLTKEQRQALFLFSNGKDTFAVLPGVLRSRHTTVQDATRRKSFHSLE